MNPEDPTRLVDHPDDSRSSVYTKLDDLRSSGSFPFPDKVHGPPRGYTEEPRSSVLDDVDSRTSPSPDPKTQPETEASMPSSYVDDPTWMRVGDIGVEWVVGVGIGGVIGIDADGLGVQHADATETAGGTIPFNDEDPNLPLGRGEASSSSSSSDSEASSDESDDEDTFIELPGVSEEFLAAMHKKLSSGNGNWRKSFSRKRIERALSAEILPRKILGRGQARVSFREQVALEAAAKAKGPSGTSTSRVATPTTSTPPAPSGVDRVTPSKRQKVDAFPAAAVGGEASASRVGGLLRDEAYSVVKSRYSELSLLFDRLVGDYDEDVRSRGSELSAAKESNVALQSRLDETVERNEALERDALALQKVKKDYDDKLVELKLRCTKAEGEAVQLRGELSSVSDLQRSRIDDAVAEARDEMTRSFAERTSEGSEPPDLLTEVKALRGRRHPIYDAHDVFADLLASDRRVLEIPVVFAGAAEASVAVDDDVEVLDEDDVEATDEDDVEATDDDENAEDRSSFSCFFRLSLFYDFRT
ncbi:hypothetical protein AALP_AA7G169700 [Arabis alpina]|uniref:Uncharacterized protein n=2 Tax=Arabis alpina TaxID=50452 RepID=A0A087GIL4_ARAAL|nr:hypothetical protein AALP_AA7G169700 [Arabis alpina]